MGSKAPPGENGEQTESGEPSRRLTIDDVPRLGSGAGIAIGCGAAVILAVALFWLVRGWLLPLH
jgi:hypothetical protein